MFRRMNPRWTGFPLAVMFLMGLMVPTIALAGNTHTEGGAVVEDVGVPETDGTAQVNIYWTGDSSDQATTTIGSTLSGHWLEDVGFLLSREWQVGDDHVAVLEFETGAGTMAHEGLYGVINKTLTSLDPDEYPDMTVRTMPVPAVVAGGGFVDLTWSPAIEDAGAPQTTNVAGYNVHRSDDGISFTQLNVTTVMDTLYQDATVAFGSTYYYALSMAYRGTPEFTGSVLSANSASVTPLDITPPDAPTLVALSAFRSGTDQQLSWSDESASGAAEYYLEVATDDQFASVVDNSGWIAGNNHTFNSLSDATAYFYRVRARDGSANESSNSAVENSTQDASPPTSNLLALAGYKTSSTVNLEWAANDATSGVQGLELFYAKDGAAYAQYAGGPWTTSPIAFDAATTGGDGDYDFYTVAQDSVGNGEIAPEAPDASITIDTQAPSMPVLAALTTFTAGNSMSPSWDDQSATGASNYRVQASTTATFDAIEQDSDWLAALTFDFTGIADAQMMHFRVQSRDNAGNESAFSAIEASTADASAPATLVEVLAVSTNQPNLDIAWSGSDATSGLAGVELFYSHNGAPFAAFAGGPFTTSPIAFDAAAMGGDGNFEFYTIGTDAVANAEAAPATSDAQISVDTQAPILPTLAALPTFSAGIERLVTWSDESASGAFEYRLEASTDAGFGSIDHDSGWITELTATFTGLSDATLYHYRVRARDAASNETATSTLQSSTQDATPAASQVAALAVFASDPMLSIEWSGSDATSGLNNVELFFSKDGAAFTPYSGGPFAATPIAFDAASVGGEGDYAFYTIASDIAGNMEAAPASADAQITIDSQPPAAPAIAALNTWNASDALLLTWSSTGDEHMAEVSDDAGFSNIVETSGWIAATTHEFTNLVDGQSYWFRTSARDNAGNESAISAEEQTTIDITAPAAALDALPNLHNAAQIDIAWSGSDATSGLVDVDLYYSKDGSAFMLDGNGPYTSSPIAFDAFVVGGDGDYSFYARARDAAGNLEAAPAAPDAQTTIDTAAPGAPSIAGMQSFTPGSELTLAWTDESASGAVEYMAEMSIAADFSSIDASSAWSNGFNHTFTSLNDAQAYYFRVKARDNAQNETGFSGEQNTTMDASAPTSNVDTLPALTASQQLDMAWIGADATSGVQSVALWYSRDGQSFQMYAGGPFLSSPIAFDASTTGGDGNYLFYTMATDAVGNNEAAPAFPDQSMTIDSQAPTAPVLASLGQWTAGNELNVSWSDQSGSGAAEYRAQASMDANFASVDFESAWINSTNHTFSGLADAQLYHFRVSARDAAMNETGFSLLEQSTMDATAPQSQITALQPFTTSSSFDLAWSGSDATSGIENVDLYISKDGAPFTMVAGGPFAASPIAFDATQHGGDGDYAFYVRARDMAANFEAAPASFDAQTTIDTAAPDAPVLAALPTFQAGSSMMISWDDLSGMGATEYRAQASTSPDFSALAEDTGWISQTTYTFNGLTNGQLYYYRTQARDAANNETAFSLAQSATQDATAPTSQLSALPTLVSSTPVDLDWSGFDITSGVAAVDLYWSRDGAPFALDAGSPFVSNPIAFDPSLTGGDGNYAFYIRAHDGAGNIELPPVAPDAQTRIDTAAPGAPLIASMPSFSAGASVALSWGSQAGSGAIEYMAELSQDADFLSLASASNWIPGTSYVFNNLDDGMTYYFRVRSRDAALNESPNADFAQTTMDDTAPASQVLALSPVMTQEDFDIAWQGNDTASGIASVELYFAKDGGAFAPYTGGPFTSSPIAFDVNNTGGEGEYAFYTRARDAVGNRETSPASPDAQTMISTSPVGIATLDALPEFSLGTDRDLAWTPGSGSTEYLVQASEDAQFTAIFGASGWTANTTWNFVGLTDGQTYWYRVRSRNVAGVEGSFSSVLASTQDAIAPISLVSPLAPVTTTEISDVAWQGSDATSGIESVDLYFAKDGGAFTLYAGGPFTSSPITFDINNTGGEGEYAFYTRARDAVGNLELSPASPDAQTVISTSPVGIAVLDAVPEFSPGSDRGLSWTPGSGSTEYQVLASSDAQFTAIFGASGWTSSTSWNFAGLSDGQTYWYRVSSRNDAGVEGSFSPTISSTQDATAPISQVAPLSKATTASQTFDLVWAGSDGTSGLSGVELMVSLNGASFAAYAGGPYTQSPISFDSANMGGDGDYAFYTIATDNAGNEELAPAQPDTEISIDSQAPAQPVALTEPEFTSGNSNTISWNAVAGAQDYLVQCALDAMFQNVLATSAWITETSYEFTNLTSGQTYFYRLRARDSANNTSPYSATVFSMQSPGRELAAGWNLISIDVAPEDANIDEVLSEIAGSYSIVRGYSDGSFHTYLPTLPVEMNDLQQLDPRRGYWIYMTESATLSVAGTPIPDNTVISMNAGWELVSYLPNQPQAPSMALFSIDASLTLARTYDPAAGYSSYYPGFATLSDLDMMQPGYGYWMYMGAADQLIYSATATPTSLEETPDRKRTQPQTVTKGQVGSAVPSVMDLYSMNVSIDGVQASAGTVVEVVDASGKVLASRAVNQDGVLGILHLMGDVSITEVDEGAVNGETLTFRIQDSDVELVTEVPIVWTANEVHAIDLRFEEAQVQLPRAYTLAQNHPNPFNPATQISYAIPGNVNGATITSTQVTLKIFDIRGRVVRSLVSARQAPGQYEARWDGKNDRGTYVSSGVYFYRLQTEHFTRTRKMMMVK